MHRSVIFVCVYHAPTLTAPTLLHRLVLSIELGTVQTGTGKVEPAWKFKCITAARAVSVISSDPARQDGNSRLKVVVEI